MAARFADPQRVERRLAMVLAADVAGYPRLMGADKEGLFLLKAHLRKLIDPKIKGHHGRIVKVTGSGMPIEFASQVEAVRRAVEAQRGMVDRNASIPADKRITFRVGTSLGDILVAAKGIYGDGVNVAARPEGLAEPGGLCISRTVRDQVHDKLPYSLENRGEQSVNSIARLVRVFALSLKAIATPSAMEWRHELIKYRRRVIDRPLALAEVARKPLSNEAVKNLRLNRRQFLKPATAAMTFFVANAPCRLVFSLGALARASTAMAQKEPGAILDRQTLVHALQSGGQVIYFRHAETDQSQSDSDRLNLANCATQRNLSDKGRAQARAISEAFSALGINVSKVLSSPYCRCVETAKLAFGRVTIVQDLEFAIAKNEAEAKRLGAVLRKLLETPPLSGTNNIVVAHSANLKEAAGIWPQPEGVAYIFQPRQNGGFTVVARVGPEEWSELARLK
ncbi:histidine phosphatase family protein [Bradyrhizobium sp. CB1650]|uniref:histidine phosphatase family protein n=1 Tax=Bradyrhizobium sp. CB1650 TaxID=3039153 RepID=UPI002434BD5B|nr:histidine phosphatase family protein [Bradyrhizobium sp. CB1650]WGD55240.1 histidine phosphatase family protein [Bradyrhizobium sp. CB1650]